MVFGEVAQPGLIALPVVRDYVEGEATSEVRVEDAEVREVLLEIAHDVVNGFERQVEVCYWDPFAST